MFDYDVHREDAADQARHLIQLPSVMSSPFPLLLRVGRGGFTGRGESSSGASAVEAGASAPCVCHSAFHSGSFFYSDLLAKFIGQFFISPICLIELRALCGRERGD